MLAPLALVRPATDEVALDLRHDEPRSAEPATTTSAVEYAFLIVGILAVLAALGLTVLHVVQGGPPA